MFCAYDIANRLANKQRSLSLYNEHISHSEYLHSHREEREKFGGAVGRVLSEIQKFHRDLLPPDATPDADVLAKAFLSSRMHPNLERCITGLAKALPYCAEGLTLALYYMDRLQRLYNDVVNCWTLDRMFATAVVVASKFAFDEVYPNTYYASRLGLSVYELNKLELSFLSLLEFKMAPDSKRWVKLHCMISRIAFEECGSRGSCPCLELPVATSAKRISYGSDLTTSTTDTPISPSPITPIITSVETPRSSRGTSVAPITITILSPESSSSSPKRVLDVVNTHGKRHSQNALGDKSHRHHHHHRHREKKSSSVTDTN